MPGICAVVLTSELCTHEKLKQANWNLLKMQKNTLEPKSKSTVSL